MKRKGMIVLVLKRMKAIACVDMNWAIGKDNKLLFHIPEDMEFFKKMTTNNVVIMGNNTLKSMGKTLPNRINVVLTSSIKGMMFVTPELIMTDAIAIEDYINSVIENTNKDIYIIGGESIYKRYLKRCSELYLTEVFTTVENADAHFPFMIALNIKYTIIPICRKHIFKKGDEGICYGIKPRTLPIYPT